MSATGPATSAPSSTSAGVIGGPDFVERTFGRTPTVPAPTVKLPTIKGGGGGGGGGVSPAKGGDVNIMPVAPDYTGLYRPDDPRLLDYLPGELARMGGGAINVTVNAAIAEATLADKIVDALTDYNRRSGPLDLQIAI